MLDPTTFKWRRTAFTRIDGRLRSPRMIGRSPLMACRRRASVECAVVRMTVDGYGRSDWLWLRAVQQRDGSRWGWSGGPRVMRGHLRAMKDI